MFLFAGLSPIFVRCWPAPTRTLAHPFSLTLTRSPRALVTTPQTPQTVPMTNNNQNTMMNSSNPFQQQQPFHQFRPTAPRPMHTTGASSKTNPKDWPQAVRYVQVQAWLAPYCVHWFVRRLDGHLAATSSRLLFLFPPPLFSSLLLSTHPRIHESPIIRTLSSIFRRWLSRLEVFFFAPAASAPSSLNLPARSIRRACSSSA